MLSIEQLVGLPYLLHSMSHVLTPSYVTGLPGPECAFVDVLVLSPVSYQVREEVNGGPPCRLEVLDQS